MDGYWMTKELPEKNQAHELPSLEVLRERFEYRDGKVYDKVLERVRFDTPQKKRPKVGKFQGERYVAARIIWKLCKGEEPPRIIKYLDGNTANTHIDNLCSASGDDRVIIPRKRNNPTGHTGVYERNGSYVAMATIGGKLTYIKSCKTLEEAIEARRLGMEAGNYGRID
jgi:hypothetical protein